MICKGPSGCSDHACRLQPAAGYDGPLPRVWPGPPSGRSRRAGAHVKNVTVFSATLRYTCVSVPPSCRTDCIVGPSGAGVPGNKKNPRASSIPDICTVFSVFLASQSVPYLFHQCNDITSPHLHQYFTMLHCAPSTIIFVFFSGKTA